MVHSTRSNPTLHPTTLRRRTDSWPSRFTAVAAMARFCGLISLPTTPPAVLPATSRFGSMPAFTPAVCCSLANRAFAEVSEPVTAVPSQPSTGGEEREEASGAGKPDADRDRLAGVVHDVGKGKHRD